MPKQRWFIDQKKQHVTSWRASGLTLQQYCELNDIPFSAFREWPQDVVRAERRANEPPVLPVHIAEPVLPADPVTIEPITLFLPGGIRMCCYPSQLTEETLAGMQRSLFEENVDADIAALTDHLDTLLPQSTEEEKTPRSQPARKPLPVHLPRQEIIIEPASTENCPDPECPGALHHIRDEVSEKLEYIPARVVVNRYVRPQYSCTCCQRVVSGEMPAHIIPKSLAEPSLIAQVVISKHCDHIPLYRQQSVLARSEIDLPVSTMADMVGHAGAALAPLAEALHRMLLTSNVLHVDETPLQILDTKKGGKSSQDADTNTRKTGFMAGKVNWLLMVIKLTGRWQIKLPALLLPGGGPMPAGALPACTKRIKTRAPQWP